LHESNIIYDIEEFKAANKELRETERESIVQSRIGQGSFRNGLAVYWEGCAITGCKLFEILKASHIKPWRCSNNAERLDVFNGLLLLPNLDSAFDVGFISFDNEGKIMISGLLNNDDKHRLGINAEMKIRKTETAHLKYLEYHRQNIFKQ
jgi:5-methylcytosine-specific restriction protein A